MPTLHLRRRYFLVHHWRFHRNSLHLYIFCSSRTLSTLQVDCYSINLHQYLHLYTIRLLNPPLDEARAECPNNFNDSHRLTREWRPWIRASCPRSSAPTVVVMSKFPPWGTIPVQISNTVSEASCGRQHSTISMVADTPSIASSPHDSDSITSPLSGV